MPTTPMFRFTYSLRTLVLIGFLVNLVGMPTVSVPGHWAGGEFPCQGHGCGCTSAEHCWHHCCCTSLEDRLAWAEEHGVAPPEDLFAQAEIGTTSGESKTDDCCTGAAPEDKTDQKSIQLRWVTTIAALKCRGQSVDWSAGTQGLLVLVTAASHDLELRLTGTIAIDDELFPAFSPAPPISFG